MAVDLASSKTGVGLSAADDVLAVAGRFYAFISEGANTPAAATLAPPKGALRQMAAKPTLSVREAAKILGIGINPAYEAVRAGTIPTIRVGKRILVLAAPLRRIIEGGDK